MILKLQRNFKTSTFQCYFVKAKRKLLCIKRQKILEHFKSTFLLNINIDLCLNLILSILYQDSLSDLVVGQNLRFDSNPLLLHTSPEINRLDSQHHIIDIVIKNENTILLFRKFVRAVLHLPDPFQNAF